MEVAGMSEGKTFYETLEEHWAESRKKNLRRILYVVGDEKREGYVEIDDLEEKFIPIRDSELCGAKITYVNSDCIREYTLDALAVKEQEHWDITVSYEATTGRIV